MKQKGSATAHVAKYQRIITALTVDEETLAEGLYNTLKEEVKDEISRMTKRPKTLSEMIEVAVRINNQQYKQRIEKKGWKF